MLPAEPATAVVGATCIVPVPSLPTTTTGWLGMSVSVPVAVEASWVVNVEGPFEEGAVSLKEVSFRVGYTHVSNFVHAFRARYNAAPRQYIGRGRE